jgi:hypothetical protein
MRREFLTAAFAPEKREGGRVKEVVWFTGIDVPRFDFWTGQEWILRLPMEKARIERLNSGAPLMKNHNFQRKVEDQVGVFEKAWIDERGIGRGVVRFAETPDVDDVWNKVEQGIIQNLSQEIAVDDLEDVTPRGQKIKLMAATGWEVEAVAIVPVGADPNAGFMAAYSPLYHQHLATTGAAGKADNSRVRLALATHRQWQREQTNRK